MKEKFISLAVIALMVYLVFTTILALGDKFVTPEHYQVATDKCSLNGGLKYLEVYTNNVYMDVVCINGATFDYVNMEREINND